MDRRFLFSRTGSNLNIPVPKLWRPIKAKFSAHNMLKKLCLLLDFKFLQMRYLNSFAFFEAITNVTILRAMFSADSSYAFYFNRTRIMQSICTLQVFSCRQFHWHILRRNCKNDVTAVLQSSVFRCLKISAFPFGSARLIHLFIQKL